MNRRPIRPSLIFLVLILMQATVTHAVGDPNVPGASTLTEGIWILDVETTFARAQTYRQRSQLDSGRNSMHKLEFLEDGTASIYSEYAKTFRGKEKVAAQWVEDNNGKYYLSMGPSRYSFKIDTNGVLHLTFSRGSVLMFVRSDDPTIGKEKTVMPSALGNEGKGVVSATSIAKMEKRYEVDGVALGDPMVEVIKRWDIDVSEPKNWCRPFPNSNVLASKLEERIYRQLMKEWEELCPRMYKAIRKNGKVAWFDHEKKLYSFEVEKKYEGHYPAKDVLAKLIEKYGKPNSPSTIKADKNTDGFRLTYQDAQRTTFMVSYRKSTLAMTLYFQSRYDDQLTSRKRDKANREIQDQLRDKYFPKSDSSEIQF